MTEFLFLVNYPLIVLLCKHVGQQPCLWNMGAIREEEEVTAIFMCDSAWGLLCGLLAGSPHRTEGDLIFVMGFVAVCRY